MFGLCCLCMCVSDPFEPFAVILGNMSSPCFNMHFLTFKTVFVWSMWPVVNKLACLPPQPQHFPVLHCLRVLNSVPEHLEKDPWGSKHELCLSQTHGQHASRRLPHNITKQSAMPLYWVAWHEEWYTTCSPSIYNTVMLEASLTLHSFKCWCWGNGLPVCHLTVHLQKALLLWTSRLLSLLDLRA